MTASVSRPALVVALVLALVWPAATRAAEDGIEWPTEGATVAGQVEVRGTAGSAGPRFRSYRLEFGAGRAPSAWQPIGPERDHSVEQAVLGLWDTRGLAPGEYALRLLVFDEGGHETESRVVVKVAAAVAAAPTSAPTPEPRPTEPAAPPSPDQPLPEPTSTPEPTAGPEPTATPHSAGSGQAPTPPPAPPAPRPPPSGRPLSCPMLYYHEVPSQASLAAQLATFLSAGYRPVTMGRVVDALEGLAEPPPGCLVLTFDDALASQMSGALPVLLRYAVPATFFVMPYFRDGVHRYMTPNDFRVLRDSGMEIGSHTLNHANLPGLLRRNFGALQAELVQSKAYLETELGQPVDLLAYPNGSWDYATAEEVRKAGYRAAAATLAGSWQRPEDLYWLRRVRADPWEAPRTVLARLRG